MPNIVHADQDPSEARAVGEEVGRLAAPFAAEHDRDGTFVHEGYEAVRKLSYGALPVPVEFGGEGHGLEGMCRAQAAIAHGCASTSLAIAMHTHAVLTMAWRWATRDDQEVGPVLRRVAEGLTIAASGTLRPAAISVDLLPAPGGYKASGRRRLASGAPGADVLVTAARLRIGTTEKVVTALVPLMAAGVTVVDDWDALGMRGSGTTSVAIADAFIPAENVLYADRDDYSAPAIAAAAADRHPQNGMHVPGLHISLPVIGSCYLGVADEMCRQALRTVASSSRADNPGAGHLAGVMVNELRLGWWALEGMIRDTTDEQLGSGQQMITTMLGKRQVVVSAIRTVEAAIELLGSATYLKGSPFERALRDVRAGITHPLPPEATLVQVGWEALDQALAND